MYIVAGSHFSHSLSCLFFSPLFSFDASLTTRCRPYLVHHRLRNLHPEIRGCNCKKKIKCRYEKCDVAQTPCHVRVK